MSNWVVGVFLLFLEKYGESATKSATIAECGSKVTSTRG